MTSFPAPDPRPRRRTVLRAGAAATVLLAGAACARIPDRSSVTSTPVDGAADPGSPYVQPRPPANGANPEEIVTGFVQAGVGGDGNYEVARQYLTPDARDAWDPTASVTVYSGGREFTTTTEGDSVRLALQAVAQVDHAGIRTPLSSPAAREVDVLVEKADGQWRISRPPAGIFLSEAAFEILFAPGRLYFLDRTEQLLVPDLRWVTTQDSGTALLRLLAAGPAPFLIGAVGTAIAEDSGLADTTIASGAGGAARVQLPATIGELPAARRGLVVSQVLSTLQSLPFVGDVRMSSGDLTLTSSDAASVRRDLPGRRWCAAGPLGIVRVPDTGTRTTQLVPELAGDLLSDPSLALQGLFAAARRPDAGAVLIGSTDGSVPRREVAGRDLVPPRVDDAGWVWTAEQADDGAVLLLSTAGAAGDRRLPVSWLGGRTVRWIDVAPDRTRLLVVSAQGDTARLDLCATTRDERGTPTGLTDPTQIIVPLPDIAQATWYDELAAIVLGSDTRGAPAAIVVDTATGNERLPAPPAGTVRVAGTRESGAVYASSGDSALLRSDGSQWQTLDAPGRDPSFF